MRRETAKKAAGAAVAAGAAGAAGAYLFDPIEGARRRHVIRDKAGSVLRSGEEQVRREAEYRAGQAAGTVKRAGAALGPENPTANDTQLAERVRSELLGAEGVPKGKININAQRGIVQLRGEVPSSEQRSELAERAQKIDGVAAVENLLHLPDEPAPNSGSPVASDPA